LGLALYKSRQLDEAILCYQQANDLDPNFVWAYNNLIVVLVEKEQFEAALDCCHRALERNPNNYPIYGYVEEFLLKVDDREKWMEMSKLMRIVVRDDIYNFKAKYMLGKIKEKCLALQTGGQ
jgi:tetratricopeptide (TPR) repeat protein